MASFVGSAQINLNEYKYIIVPKIFDSFKKANQHKTSTYIKHVFTQKKFNVVYDDNMPVDLSSDRCLGLVVDLIDNSSMFTTKTTIRLKDCKGKEVFLSQQGKSKKKEYQASYAEAIDKAFASFAAINYTYEPKVMEKQEEPVTLNFKDDIKTLDESSNRTKSQDSAVERIATKDVQYYKDHTPVETDIKSVKTSSEKKMMQQEATREDQSFKSMEPVPTNFKKMESAKKAKVSEGILYAQELPNGFQLVDSTPKIQLKIFKSSMPNVYIAKADNHDGVVYLSDGKWFFEYHEGGEVVKEELNIKF